MGIHIAIRNLHKVYLKGSQSVPVLEGVNLELEAGSHIAIMGVSGAGKSTLLHILGTLERPTSGQVLFDGSDVFAQNPAALATLRNRSIGFVFQFHHLLDEFSAVENVAMPLLIRGDTRRSALAAAAAVLEGVGLKHRLSHRPTELSGGEQQRVAIARALVARPRLLLMDEPTGNLDTATAADVHGLIVEVAKDLGATLVVVTHNPEFADAVGRVYRIKAGAVAA